MNIIEKLEALPSYFLKNNEMVQLPTGKGCTWINVCDIYAIIEEYKATEQAPVCFPLNCLDEVIDEAMKAKS